MSFNKKPQVFSGAINAVEMGCGDKKIVLGGEKVLPFYSFDAPIENKACVGMEISDLGTENYSEGIKAFYGTSDVVEMAKKAAALPGVDFICLNMEGADPNGKNKSVEECVDLAKKVSAAIDAPIAIMGSKNAEKDGELFNKLAEALQGKNVLFLSACEENYKAVGASVGLAYNQVVGAESAVDINLAKQMNVLLSQLGVKNASIVMNVGSAAAGYGFEYIASTMDRVKMAALSQNDAMLQMPIITPVCLEAWSVKEAIVSEADMPEWGAVEQRGVNMEVVTASACLTAGSNAVVLRHPDSVAAISKMINALA